MEDYGVRELKEAILVAIRAALKITNTSVTLVMHAARKTNQNKADAICLKSKKDNELSPVLYMDDLIAEYQSGNLSIDDFGKEIAQRLLTLNQEKESLNIQITPDAATEHLYLQVINKKLNPDIAESCAHTELPGGLIAVPRWRIDETKSVLVDKNIQGHLLEMTDSELLNVAKANTLKQEYTVKSMRDTLAEIMEQDMPKEIVAEMLPEAPEPIYVISNSEKLFGASALLSPDVLEKAHETLGEDYFVILSSLHEVLAVPASLADPADLRHICREVNATQLQEKDLLGDSILFYNSATRSLHECNSIEELRKIQETIPVTQKRIEHPHIKR